MQVLAPVAIRFPKGLGCARTDAVVRRERLVFERGSVIACVRGVPRDAPALSGLRNRQRDHEFLAHSSAIGQALDLLCHVVRWARSAKLGLLGRLLRRLRKVRLDPGNEHQPSPAYRLHGVLAERTAPGRLDRCRDWHNGATLSRCRDGLVPSVGMTESQPEKCGLRRFTTSLPAWNA